MQIPDDTLFVNRAVHDWGFREEFSICAYYHPGKRAHGAIICNDLALDRSVPEGLRAQSRANLYFYLRPLHEHIPSLSTTRLDFTPPDGYAAMNPSVIVRNGQLVVLVRTVNYKITPEGRYVSRSGTGDRIGDIDVIRTRNHLVHVNRAGAVTRSAELQLPKNWPDPPAFPLVRGLEDSRLFEFNGHLWTISACRELTPEGWCEQVLAPLVDTGDWTGYGENWTRILPETGRHHEKNWMPWAPNAFTLLASGAIEFVYRPGVVIDQTGKITKKTATAAAVDHFGGGSQVIEIAPQVNLAVVHEAGMIPGRPTRYYQHRFLLMDADGAVVRVSRPFFFHDRQIEYVAGLALADDRLIMSYGVRDEEAWTASCRLDDALRFIQEVPA